ncbi:hypothetical protein RJ40_01155 [Methanofollis aquaemaris]|uniref:Archaeal Type IV pilin N-terminal domain-containing protein n=1 Tax=Methanofollis aquaemaris TaxID=126734 RepID=A0A8A3S201_9EURY|nr:hypothetical protein [Methanofollis aquaemaris]QSZ66202.1 hypothetical protein RJ40_01155 [Methanofollis aquaemaris]
MEKDEAVSTVIALMLVLGILATVIAIYSATYLPGLKQQSEIEHSHEVADAFVRFGSDIDYVVSHKTTARFSEPFSLGGGEVLLSPVRSSGTVTIEEKNMVKVTVSNQTQTRSATASIVNISYVPSFTTWEPQGYRWEYGFVEVTKDERAVPQSSRYHTRADALEDSDKFLGSFIDVIDSNNGIEITLVNLVPENGSSCITGSGIATLGLNATADSKGVSLTKVTKIVFEDLTSDSMMTEHLDYICNDIRSRIPGATYDPDTHTLEFDPAVNPVSVTLRAVNGEVSVC